MDSKRKVLLSAAGIFVCYFYFGIFQENITKGHYVTADGKTEIFTYSLSLVFALCLVNYIFSKLLTSTVVSVADDNTWTMYYCSQALTTTLAMICTNMALQFVNYPTQVLAKSSKPIPVMILGVLLGRRSYHWKKYFFVLLVVIGISLFLYKDKKTAVVSEDDFGFGVTLLFLSLVMDGLNGAIQERMLADHQTKPMAMMLNCNFWATIYLLLGIGLTGEVFDFFGFIQRHPQVLWKLLTLAVAGCLGQFFIFKLVADSGPLPTAIVTTVRKFFTVLFSVVFFGNALLPRQWLATFIVFAGLFLDIFYGKVPPKAK